MVTARQLSEAASGADRLVSAYASSNIEIYPYQIAATMFALRSPYLKGAVLADEGSLGKTYESLLVISQLYFEGRDRILVIVPTPLLHQWTQILENRFSVPFTVVERSTPGDNPFDADSVVLTTYECAAEKAEMIRRVEWNIAVFEEAHRLSKPDNKTTIALKEAVGDAFKLLLTATPMQNSIMDLYGLIDFIDTGALGDADEFYKRYFRKPENYGELTATANRYCFRTLRSQVEGYVKIPRRIPVTADYPLSSKEVKLAALVDAYLKKPDKRAFPKMDSYDLTLMFSRAISSSPFALCKLADGAYGRVQEPELKEMAELAAEIKPQSTGKGQSLLKALKIAFAELKKRGANRKAIIFTENRATLWFVHKLLEDTYKVLAFDGSKSSDYSVIQKFEQEAEILITTDVAAEGFNLDFCSFVVNYDLPYNVLTLEQRIMRCHRQGQQNDVVVLNFLSKQNFADVRMLELINKRVLQFDGIMGMSDDVVGNFTDSAVDGIAAAFEQARHRNDIESEFRATLAAHEDTNTSAVDAAENALFTTFTRDVADKVTVTPQYIKDRTAELNAKLWEIVAPLLSERGYSIDETEQTATLPDGTQPPQMFYYWTGTRNKPHIGLRAYGAGHDFKPAAGRLTLASPIGRGAIHNVECADEGTVTIRNEELGVRNCNVAFYEVTISEKGAVAEYYAFAGKTADGEPISDEDCRALMDLPVIDFTETGRRSPAWLKSSTGHSKPHELDRLIDTQPFKDRAALEISDARREEIAAIQERARREKSLQSREIESLKNELRQIENTLSRTASASERVDAEKRRATASKSLKGREQTLFMDGLRIDAGAEAAVQALTENAHLTASITRLFVVSFQCPDSSDQKETRDE
jgi:hypothetical protein